MEEHRTFNPLVLGSSPRRPTTKYLVRALCVTCPATLLDRLCRESAAKSEGARWGRCVSGRRARGSWRCRRVGPGDGPLARVIRTVRTTSKREAKAALARLEVEVASGQVGPDDPTVAELLERWLEHLERLGRSRRDAVQLPPLRRPELVPAIGGVRLSKLTARRPRRVVHRVTRRGLAPATVRQIHAIDPGRVEPGGAVGHGRRATSRRWRRRLRNRSASSTRRRLHEVLALIDAAVRLDPMFGLYVRVVAATGMRRAEACGLRWSDVDLEAGRLTVQRSHISLPGSVGDRPTKTRSVRTVTLDDGTVRRWGRHGEQPASSLASPAWTTTPAGPATCSASTPTGRQAWRGDTVSTRWDPRPPERRHRRRPPARSAPLASDPAARRRGAGTDGGRPPRSRRRHDHDEDLRPPHRTRRRAGGPGRRVGSSATRRGELGERLRGNLRRTRATRG